MLNVAFNWDFQSIKEKKNPKYLNIDKASPTEECSGRGTLTHQFLPGKHHGIHSFTNPGATGTSCDYTPGVPRDSTAASATWGGKTAPRDVLSSQQKLSLDILQLFLILPKEDSLRNLPQRKQSRAGIINFGPVASSPNHHITQTFPALPTTETPGTAAINKSWICTPEFPRAWELPGSSAAILTCPRLFFKMRDDRVQLHPILVTQSWEELVESGLWDLWNMLQVLKAPSRSSVPGWE